MIVSYFINQLEIRAILPDPHGGSPSDVRELWASFFTGPHLLGYPLVSIQFAMENHHVQWVIPAMSEKKKT